MNINFIPKISSVLNQNTKTVSFSRLPDMPYDSFVKASSQVSSVSKVDETYKTALDFCRQSVVSENPVESQMVFDSEGNVLYQNVGDEKSCKIEDDKLVYGSTAVHSHPLSCTLSDVDAMALVTKPKLSKVASIDASGRSCSLKKPDDYNRYYSKEESRALYYLLNDTMTNIWKESLPKVDNPKAFCMQENERRLMQAFGFNDVNTMYQSFESTRTGDPDTDMSNIGWRFWMPEATSKNIKPVDLSDAEWNATKIQIEQMDGTPEAIEIGKKVNKAFAEILGLEYSYSDAE